MANRFQTLLRCLWIPVMCAGIGCVASLATGEKETRPVAKSGSTTDAAAGNAVRGSGRTAPIEDPAGLGAGALIGDHVEAHEQAPQRQPQ